MASINTIIISGLTYFLQSFTHANLYQINEQKY